MNSKIKNAGIVLTGGILLGFGSSVTLAGNVIGTGYYGTEQSPAAAGDNASDIIMWDDANGYLTIAYGNTDGLSVHSGTSGSVVAVDIMAGGHGYTWNGAGEACVVNNEGTTGLGAAMRYFCDNFSAEGIIDSSMYTITNMGYGYRSYVDGGTAATSYIMGWTTTSTPACLVDPAGGQYASADGYAGLIVTYGDLKTATNSIGAVEVADADAGCPAYTDTADENGEICGVDDVSGGAGTYGYGNAETWDGTIYVDGVADGEFEITSNADGTLDNSTFDITLQSVGANNAADVSFMLDDAPGSGFYAYGIVVYGAIFGITPNWDQDGDCTNLSGDGTQTSLALSWNYGVLCDDCELTGDGSGFEVEWDDYPVGAVDVVVVDSGGQNYDMAPTVETAVADTGTGASLAAVVGGSYFDMTYADGLRPDLANPAWRFYCGADYNDDGNSDLVAHDTANGQVYIYNCGDQGMIEEQVYVADAGADWKIAGQLDVANAAGHGLCWYKEASGATAVWICNSGATGETPVLDPRTSLTTSANSSWYMACTNDSQGGGNRSYWYNDTYGTNAWWSWDVDANMPAADWVDGADHFYDGDGHEVNTGAYGGWMMEKVGCLSGQSDEAADPNRDIVWANADTGAVCMWMCNQDDPGVVDSRDYCTVDGNMYNGGDYGISGGNRCVGIGQYDVGGVLFINPDESDATASPDTHTATFGSVWWNNSGNVTCWKMDRTIDLEIWDQDGETADSGTGLSKYPETVSEYQKY